MRKRMSQYPPLMKAMDDLRRAKTRLYRKISTWRIQLETKKAAH